MLFYGGVAAAEQRGGVEQQRATVFSRSDFFPGFFSRKQERRGKTKKGLFFRLLQACLPKSKRKTIILYVFYLSKIMVLYFFSSEKLLFFNNNIIYEVVNVCVDVTGCRYFSRVSFYISLSRSILFSGKGQKAREREANFGRRKKKVVRRKTVAEASIIFRPTRESFYFIESVSVEQKSRLVSRGVKITTKMKNMSKKRR